MTSEVEDAARTAEGVENMDHDMERRKYACWFYGAPGIGDRTMAKMSALCPDFQESYLAGETLWRRVLTTRQLEGLRRHARDTDPDTFYDGMLKKGIWFASLHDADYPRRLRNIPDPPFALFVKGRLPEEDVPSVAVVGARDGSEYGRYVAAGIGRALGESGIQVISGMARGIDGISQNAALEAGGRSFGVLGCGVDVCYPASNRSLYEKLCERGGILSAYAPGTEARPQNFPPRNRIVSGLADALIVVEARNKSGTLITVDMALEQGKDVYAAPGRVTDRLSDGCNNLIRQGAGVFLSPEEFLGELWENWGRKMRTDAQIMRERRTKDCGNPAAETKGGAGHRQPAPELEEVRGALDFYPRSVEEIGRRLHQSHDVQTLGGMLMRLCLEGAAMQVSPGHFALKA